MTSFYIKGDATWWVHTQHLPSPYAASLYLLTWWLLFLPSIYHWVGACLRDALLVLLKQSVMSMSLWELSLSLLIIESRQVKTKKMHQVVFWLSVCNAAVCLIGVVTCRSWLLIRMLVCLHVLITATTQTASLHDHQLTPLSHVCSTFVVAVIVVVCLQCYAGWLGNRKTMTKSSASNLLGIM